MNFFHRTFLLAITLIGVSAPCFARPHFRRVSSADQQLVSAIVYNNPMGARRALAHGANPNLWLSSGRSVLMEAIIDNNVATVKLLLAAGADPYSRDCCGWSVFDYAQDACPRIQHLLMDATCHYRVYQPQGWSFSGFLHINL